MYWNVTERADIYDDFNLKNTFDPQDFYKNTSALQELTL